MKMKEALQGYDYDLPLKDALNDPILALNKRLIAGAAFGVGLDAAYFGTVEMLEAFAALEADHRAGVAFGEGYLAVEAILDARSPFQMRLWHLLNETSIATAVQDLAWLKAVTLARAQMQATLKDAGAPFWFTPAADLVEGPTATEMMAATSPFDAG